MTGSNRQLSRYDSEVDPWDKVLLGADYEDDGYSPLTGLLVESEPATARRIFRGFDQQTQLAERWSAVVANYTTPRPFAVDDLQPHVESYLNQVARLALAYDNPQLAAAADINRIQVDDSGPEWRASPLTHDWLEIIEHLTDAAAPSGWQELETRSIKAVLGPVGSLPELLYFMAEPLQPSSLFDPSYYFQIWSGNANLIVDAEAVKLGPRVVG